LRCWRDEQRRGFRVQSDVYRVLGVSSRAAHPQIKAAFHNLAKAYHPDVRPDDRTAEEHFKEVSAAYDVLKRKESRVLYDRYRSRRRKGFPIMVFLLMGLPSVFGGLVGTTVWLKWHANPGEHATLAPVTGRDERVHYSLALSVPQTELRDPRAPEHPPQPSWASTEAIQDSRNVEPAALSTGSQSPQDASPWTETTLYAALPAETLPEKQGGGADESRKHEEPASSTSQHAVRKPATKTGSGKTRKTIALPSTSATRAAAWQYTTERPGLGTRVPSPAGERFIDPAGISR
jgi:curved DNA-binding protein CbpA